MHKLNQNELNLKINLTFTQKKVNFYLNLTVKKLNLIKYKFHSI